MRRTKSPERGSKQKDALIAAGPRATAPVPPGPDPCGPQPEPVTAKTSEPTQALPEAETVKTYRQLRFMKALFQIDDPELERALSLIVERLAGSGPRDS